MGEEEQEEHNAMGWKFGMESSGELDLLSHHHNELLGSILGNCQIPEPSLSGSRYPVFHSKRGSRAVAMSQAVCGTRTLVWL